jgi:hypothetical protein
LSQGPRNWFAVGINPAVADMPPTTCSISDLEPIDSGILASFSQNRDPGRKIELRGYFPPQRTGMNSRACQALAGTLLILTALRGWAADRQPCADAGPPSIWIVKSSYPFQQGAERTFDELYHGPWRARIDLTLYARPRSHQVVGKVQRGKIVQALLGESIVVRPLRFIASQDFRVVRRSNDSKVQLTTMHKGDVFWVLDSGNEGEFAIWWHCRVVGWDSTEAPAGDPNRLDLLGTNQERWVEVRDPRTGLSGWFNDVQVQDGPKLVPAEATTKSTG